MSPRVPYAVALLVALGGTAASQDAAKPMQINELEASGSFTWVELKNTGDASEPLDGYSIQVERISSSDQTQRNFAFRFESGAAAAPRGAAGSIVVVCFGGFSGPQQEPNCDSPGRNYCSNTCAEGDLDQDGGVVSLLWRPPCQVVTPVVVDSIPYPPLGMDEVFGRNAVDDWCVLIQKTPGEENAAPLGPNSECLPNRVRVVINEVSTAGGSDWVEIFLTGENPAPVHLANYALNSQGTILNLPPVTLEAGDLEGDGCDHRYATIVLNGLPPASACPLRVYSLPTDIQLNAAGDSLTLSSQDGSEWDRVLVFPLDPEIVQARIPDGGEWKFTSQPTPSSPNPAVPFNLPPTCEIIDRFPLRVLPIDDDPVRVYVRALDRDGPVDLKTVSLSWEFDPVVGGEPVRSTVPMQQGKRVTCERFDEPGIFVAEIPRDQLPTHGDVRYWATATDAAAHTVPSSVETFFLQNPDFTDPGDAYLLRINEVAANAPEMEGDWVEIFNPSAQPVFLAGLFLTENVFRLEGRRLDPANGNLLVPPGGFLQIHLTDDPAAAAPKLSFRLDNCRDEVLLLYRDGKTVLDVVEFHEEKVGRTLARIPDGGAEFSITKTPTPGASNVASSCLAAADTSPESPFVINEVCADNWTVIKDRGGEYGDWVELWNRTGEEQVLDCWSLADSWGRPELGRPSNSTWRFPPGIRVTPGGFLLVWCDNDDDCETPERTGELHTNFQLNRSSDLLQLLDPCGKVADGIFWSFLPRDGSVGRLGSSPEIWAFLAASPNAENPRFPLPDLPPTACLDPPVELRIGASPCPGGCPFFRRGDANSDCGVQITDAIFTLNFLFVGGSAPRCQDAADTNDDGKVDLADAITVLGYLFLGGAEPPTPGPESPGKDPTLDGLTTCEGPNC